MSARPRAACPSRSRWPTPHVTGIGLDLSPVQPVFEDYVREHGVADRLRFQVFDLFKDRIPKVDVITMGHILHGWKLADKRGFIKKAYDALSEGGVLIVYDAMIDDERRENVAGFMMSLTHPPRDARGIRLHERRLRGLASRARLPRRPRGAAHRMDSFVVGVK